MVESIAEAVRAHATQIPDRLCVADGKDSYSYGQIWEKVLSYAAFLHKKGLQGGDCVAVECTQDASFLICALACQLSGFVFVPVERKAAVGTIRMIVEEVSAKLYIYGTETQVDCPKIQMSALREESAGGRDDGNLPRKEAIAEILYTTGTTGKSKGIVLLNRNNVAVAENVLYGTEMKEDNVELVPLPLSHSHGLRTCYANLLNGSSVVLSNGVINVKGFFELMDTYRVTALDLSPSAAKVLLKLSRGHLGDYSGQIDYIEIGTATLDEDVKEELCRTFPASRLYNFYGSTESGRSCILDFNATRGKKGCIGMPTKNATFVVTDDEREPIQSSEARMGLFAIAGDMNMLEYYRAEELTKATMHRGYIYTNDIGYIAENGEVYLFGRKGSIINYKGIKIAPEEIETVAMKYEAVADCACVPQKDAIGGEVPKLYVAAAPGKPLVKQELMVFLSKHLEQNRMPKMIEIIDQIPRAANGKILRNRLTGQ